MRVRVCVCVNACVCVRRARVCLCVNVCACVRVCVLGGGGVDVAVINCYLCEYLRASSPGEPYALHNGSAIVSASALQSYMRTSFTQRVRNIHRSACSAVLLLHDQDPLRATAVTRRWNGHRNKNQHRKLILEKKFYPAAHAGTRTHDLSITRQSLSLATELSPRCVCGHVVWCGVRVLCVHVCLCMCACYVCVCVRASRT